MDILAHGLWAGLGVRGLARTPPSPAIVAATVFMAVLPDIVHLLPVIAWALFDGGSLAGVLGYAFAVPGQEPGLPAWAAAWSHHLHCTLHSALVAGGTTLLLWPWRQRVGLPLYRLVVAHRDRRVHPFGRVLSGAVALSAGL
jgi:hypothetical protein